MLRASSVLAGEVKGKRSSEVKDDWISDDQMSDDKSKVKKNSCSEVKDYQ
jgi:hypothetical protein